MNKLKEIFTILSLKTEAAFPVGHVTHRKEGDFVKVGVGQWKRVLSSKGSAEPSATLAPSVHKLHQAVLSGKLEPNMTLKDHIDQAQKAIGAHHRHFKKTMLDMHHLAPPGARIEGRVKKIDSLLEKLPRRSDLFKKAHDIPDTTGIRIICKNVQQVRETADKLKKQYPLVRDKHEMEQDWNYLDNPLGDWKYRSHHLYFHDKDGLAKELQIRTENQHKFADWCHKLYKPKSAEQLEALNRHKTDIDAYARSMSDHYWNLDNGRESKAPGCPAAVKEHFGCLD
jgi:ppGpp synthetase/RelA/SpoT-type nucleotidyltranferase